MSDEGGSSVSSKDTTVKVVFFATVSIIYGDWVFCDEWLYCGDGGFCYEQDSYSEVGGSTSDGVYESRFFLRSV